MKIIACLKQTAVLFLVAVGVFVTLNVALAAADPLVLEKPAANAVIKGDVAFDVRVNNLDEFFWVNLYYKDGSNWILISNCMEKWFDLHQCYVDSTKYPDGNYTLKAMATEGGYKSPELTVRFANGGGVLEISGATTRTINNRVTISGKEANKIFDSVDLKFTQVVNYPQTPVKYNYSCQKQGVSSVWNCVVDTTKMLDATYDVYLASGAVSSRKVVMTVKNGNNQCKPKTCRTMSYNCGEISDGCGATLSCGTCSSGYACKSNKCQRDSRKVSFIKYNPKTTSWVSGTDEFKVYAVGLSANDKVSLGLIYASPYNTKSKINKTVVSTCAPTNTSYSNYICSYNTAEIPNGEATFYILLDDIAVKNSMVKVNISNSTCKAKTCTSANIGCGVISDGCGGKLNCGSCSAGYSCISGKCSRQATTLSFIKYNAKTASLVSGTDEFKVYAKNLTATDKVSLATIYTAPSGMRLSKTLVDQCQSTNASYANYICAYNTKDLDDGEYTFYLLLNGAAVANSGVKITTSNYKNCTRLKSCVTSRGISCALLDDGCGGTLDCRTCPTGYDCANEICQRQNQVPITQSLMIVYPVANDYVTGTSTFKVYPSGFSGPQQINLYRTFTKFGTTFTALAHQNCTLDNSAYYCELDTTKYGNGEYQFYATTADGKVVSEKVTVNIQNTK